MNKYVYNKPDLLILYYNLCCIIYFLTWFNANHKYVEFASYDIYVLCMEIGLPFLIPTMQFFTLLRTI